MSGITGLGVTWIFVEKIENVLIMLSRTVSELCQNMGIKEKPTTDYNPQLNAILECIHQVLGNQLRSFELEDQELTKEETRGSLKLQFEIDAAKYRLLAFPSIGVYLSCSDKQGQSSVPKI